MFFRNKLLREVGVEGKDNLESNTEIVEAPTEKTVHIIDNQMSQSVQIVNDETMFQQIAVEEVKFLFFTLI